MLKKMLMQMEGADPAAGGDWRAALPEDLRANPTLADVKDIATLAKRLVDTKALVGNSLRPPGPDASDEAKAEFRAKLQEKVPDLVYLPEGDEKAEAELWKRLGKPGKPEDYDIDPALKEEGVSVEELRALAAQAGLTKKQFKALASQYAEGQKSVKAAQAAEARALKTEWGEAFEERTIAAKAVALKMGVAEADLGKLSAREIRIFANVAKAMSSSGNPLRETGATLGRLAPAEALAEMAEIRGNPAYWNDSENPSKQKALVARMVELTKMAYPGA